MLADLVHGKAAVADRALLANVVKHKKVFYNASYANYDACLTGQLRLIPEDAALAALHARGLTHVRYVHGGMSACTAA